MIGFSRTRLGGIVLLIGCGRSRWSDMDFSRGQHHDVFRPGTTRAAVMRAMRMGKADLVGDF